MRKRRRCGMKVKHDCLSLSECGGDEYQLDKEAAPVRPPLKLKRRRKRLLYALSQIDRKSAIWIQNPSTSQLIERYRLIAHKHRFKIDERRFELDSTLTSP